MEARQDEQVVAVLPSPEEVVDQKREAINGEIAVIVNRAQELVITTPQEYEQAAEMGREIRRQAKAVKDLFQPIKEAANKAHKAACERERLMLAPLNEAERIIKTSMSAYTTEQERKRRELEEQARLQALQEQERLLAAAVAQDAAGNSEQAEQTLAEAQVIGETPVAVAPSTQKVKGVSNRIDWEIDSIDLSAVPVEIAGVIIRPVDEAAVMRLVRASKGKIAIPGIKIKEVTKTILRA